MQATSEIREHMEVVGADGEHVGTVDHLEGQRLKLTKSDPNAKGQHHFLGLDQVDHIEEGKVCLNISAERAMQTWAS
jgi:hypothetical protein